jgi:D-lactate dehydrogenase (cytochrome)
MSCTNLINLESVLEGSEQEAIDAFCAEHNGIDSLAVLADFLRDRFALELTLDPGIINGFVTDGSNLPGAAQALCRPKNEKECSLVLRSCFQAGIPVTVSGGKSNLTGSATPEGGVLLSTINLTTPLPEIDVEKKTVRTGPGIILEELRKTVLRETGNKLCFPVDPTSRAEASVGGGIACNCSGFTPGETGAMRPWIQSIRVLLPNGRLIDASRGQYRSGNGIFLLDGVSWPVPQYKRPSIKNASGPFSSPDGQMDLIDLIVGAEGIYGLVSECTLMLDNQPECCLDLFFSLPGEADAVQLLETVQAHFHGDLSGLKAFEYFGVNCRRYMKHESRFFHGNDQVGIYICQPVANGDQLEAAEQWLELIVEAGIDIDEEALIMLDSPKLQEIFMEARHSMPAHAIEIAQQRGAFTIMSDTVVPLESFREFLDFSHQRLRDEKLDYLNFGHLGDCHLHFMLIPERQQIESAVAVYDDLIQKSADLDGVYSGEHGTGKRKRQDFLRCYGSQAAEQILLSRQAVDPQLLFNRGNVIAS